MSTRLTLTLFLGFILALRSQASEPPAPPPVFVGVDANYSLDLEKEGRTWRWDGAPRDLFQGMADHGLRGLRVRLWTGDEGPNGKTYATEVVKRGRAAGLEPYLVIFLSEDWADLMKQPVPAIWKDLDLEQRAEAVHVYSRDVVTHFRQAGLRSHLYEIGNEIDYGICGVYPSKNQKKNPESLARSCWPQAAKLILASQRGVREADPEARFLLHIAHWWDPEFCEAFFRFMLAQGVAVDYAGLSYFPSSNIGGSLEMGQFGSVVTRLHAAISRPIIVPETAYPSTSDFKGQFSRWKKESPGYPLTPDGQQRWLADFLDFCARHPAIDSVYYWSPEWCGEGMWKAFALFTPEGEAKPAWSAFAPAREKRTPVRTPVCFELQDGLLRAVPVEEARRRANEVLVAKLKEWGRVNVDYIQAITNEVLVVEGYRVHLRASLSGNLDLVREPVKPAADPGDSWKSLLEPVQPATEQMVLFVRDLSDPLLASVRATADERGIRVAVHPLPAGQPLKFGLGNEGLAAANESPDPKE
jgi:arabinogalactan endo-1,4-beta-galactosidase